MTHHTPGPWRAVHRPGLSWEIGDGRCLVATADLYPPGSGLGAGPDTVAANARLIAAAPGMLAALRLVARDAMTLGACLRDETVVAVGAALTAAQEAPR